MATQLLNTIKERRSIRSFKSKEIPSEIIEQLIEALIWAPSAGNLQARKFYFVFNEEIKNQMVDAAHGQSFIAEAPVAVVACTNDEIENKYGNRGKNLYTICDVSLSIQNMLLLAHEFGLGTCLVGAFNHEKVVEALNTPSNLHPILIVPVGYSAENPNARSRVSKNEAIKILK